MTAPEAWTSLAPHHAIALAQPGFLGIVADGFEL